MLALYPCNGRGLGPVAHSPNSLVASRGLSRPLARPFECSTARARAQALLVCHYVGGLGTHVLAPPRATLNYPLACLRAALGHLLARTLTHAHVHARSLTRPITYLPVYLHTYHLSRICDVPAAKPCEDFCSAPLQECGI